MDKTMTERLQEMHQGQEEWALTLDHLDGLVAQTIARGWPEEAAQGLVATAFCTGMQRSANGLNADAE